MDRRRVDMAERVRGDDLVEAGDVLHHERDVAQWGTYSCTRQGSHSGL